MCWLMAWQHSPHTEFFLSSLIRWTENTQSLTAGNFAVSSAGLHTPLQFRPYCSCDVVIAKNNFKAKFLMDQLLRSRVTNSLWVKVKWVGWWNLFGNSITFFSSGCAVVVFLAYCVEVCIVVCWCGRFRCCDDSCACGFGLWLRRFVVTVGHATLANSANSSSGWLEWLLTVYHECIWLSLL